MAARRGPTNARRARWSGIARDFGKRNLRRCLARASGHSAARVLSPTAIASATRIACVNPPGFPSIFALEDELFEYRIEHRTHLWGVEHWTPALGDNFVKKVS
jgi:hypothetical protein